MQNQHEFPRVKKGNTLKGIAARLGFHLIAFFVAMIVVSNFIDIPFHPAKGIKTTSDQYEAGVGILIYASLLLLFPKKINKIDTAFGVVVAIAWAFFGPWVLGLAFGALLVLACRLCRERRYILFSAILPVFCILMALGDIYPLRAISLIYCAIYIVIGGLAILYSYRSGTSTKNAGDSYKTSREKIDAERTEMAAKHKEKENKLTAEEIRQRTILAQHKKTTIALLKLGQQLPVNIAGSVVVIAEQAKLILYSMENDPRDFAPGDKFLQRYLAAALMIAENNIKLSNQSYDKEAFSKTLEQSGKALKSLETAFIEQHHRLLENDVLDFTVELNVLDRLLQIEGYNEPKI